MELEETPSGNWRLFSAANPKDSFRVTRADVRAIADVFALLDRWDREDAGDAGVPEDA